MNRKERRLALRTALVSRMADLIVVKDFADQLPRPKTKELTAAMDRWGVTPGAKVLLITAEKQENVYLSARNIAKVKLIPADHLNMFDLLNADQIVATAGAISKIQEVYGE
jgi:large subunit ribosomal protein L4